MAAQLPPCLREWLDKTPTATPDWKGIELHAICLAWMICRLPKRLADQYNEDDIRDCGFLISRLPRPRVEEALAACIGSMAQDISFHRGQAVLHG